MKKIEEREWWPELVALKDVMSLRELSARFGAAPAAISNALKRNGLNRSAAPPGPRDKRDDSLKEAAAAAVAAVEQGDLAEAAAVEPAPPAKKTRAKKAEPKKAAAKKAEPKKAEPKKAAAKKAEPKKAEPKKAEPKKARGGRGRGSRIETYAHLLGVEIDRVIADKAGVSVSAVTNYRKRHGISSATRGEGAPVVETASVAEAPAPAPVEVAPAAPAPAPEAAPKAAPKAASKAAAFGYKVAIGSEEFVVVAADIAEAAGIALASGKGAVTRIELLGTAIG